MFFRTQSFDTSVAVMDQLRRQMDRLFDDFDGSRHVPVRTSLFDELERARPRSTWPVFRLSDEGTTLVVRAEVPGLSDKDVQLTIHQDVLTMTGERKNDAPEGAFVHRRERPELKFAKSFSLPCKVDPEKSTAVVKNGILTITLAKALEAQPRQISIRAQ